MLDSKPQDRARAFLRKSKGPAKSVIDRLFVDGKKILFSEESELKVLTTTAVVGTAAIFFPSVFAIVGAMTIASAALDTRDEVATTGEAEPVDAGPDLATA